MRRRLIPWLVAGTLALGFVWGGQAAAQGGIVWGDHNRAGFAWGTQARNGFAWGS